MVSIEPYATALVLAAFGVLLTVSVASSRASARLGVPLTLVFLLIGVLAGSEGIGKIPFEDYSLTFRLGTIALVLILFDGGLNTPTRAIRLVVGPATALATIGVALTALATSAAAHLLGFSWPHGLLIGAIVSSTDAAAVFSVLTSSGIHLRRRVGSLLEVESGFNDPMAVILTTALTANLARPGTVSTVSLIIDVVRELVLGAVIGYAIGRGANLMMRRLRLPAAGLYPVFTLGVAFLAFAVPTLTHSSGFLAVYVAGVALGGRSLPHRVGIRRVHDALGWLSQIVMFLVLGLLVFPTRLVSVAVNGLAIALFLAFIARPVVVMLCLAPFRLPFREVAYVSWVGLRGAVPIVLATIPVLGGLPEARYLFDIVFFVVVVGAIVPGSTVPWMTRRLGVGMPGDRVPTSSIEIDAPGAMSSELRSFYIDASVAVVGATLSEIPFPASAAVTVIERGGELFAPSGSTRLEVGDHVYVFSARADRPHVDLLFGRAEELDED